jgi:hypothetical protein
MSESKAEEIVVLSKRDFDEIIETLKRARDLLSRL